MRYSTWGLAIGAQLRAARAFAGMEQVELARAAGLHPNSVRRLERMDRIPSTSWHAAKAIVEALRARGIEVDDRPTPSVRFGGVVGQAPIEKDSRNVA